MENYKEINNRRMEWKRMKQWGRYLDKKMRTMKRKGKIKEYERKWKTGYKIIEYEKIEEYVKERKK